MSRLLGQARRDIIVVMIVLVVLVGCGLDQGRRAAPDRTGAKPAVASSETSQSVNDASAKTEVKGRFVNFQQPASTDRKIIYDAEINLVVKKVAEAETQITRLLKEADGYVAEANVDRTQGEELTGRWKVRVPVAKFDAFLEEVSKLGVAESRRQTAQDVTAEFVDLEAQIANKKKLEERIVALLKDTSGKIKDIIEVERELARVRGEIELMEGRLRYLTNRTDFTTVSIAAREQENYVPPAAPSFMARIGQAWNTSLVSLRDFAQRLVVAAVYTFPWLAVLCVVAVPKYFFARKRKPPVGKRADGNPAQQ